MIAKDCISICLRLGTNLPQTISGGVIATSLGKQTCQHVSTVAFQGRLALLKLFELSGSCHSSLILLFLNLQLLSSSDFRVTGSGDCGRFSSPRNLATRIRRPSV